jgi:hypothetical protein
MSTSADVDLQMLQHQNSLFQKKVEENEHLHMRLFKSSQVLVLVSKNSFSTTFIEKASRSRICKVCLHH